MSAIDPGLICVCFPITLLALAMFLSARSRHGNLASIIALGLGGVLGAVIGLIGAFWNSIDGCRSIDDVWQMVKIDHRHVFQYRAGLIPVAGFFGMLASWLSLRVLGPFLIRRRPADTDEKDINV